MSTNPPKIPPPQAAGGILEKKLSDRFGITPAQLSEAKKLNATNQLGLIPNLKKMSLLSDKQSVELESESFSIRIVKLKGYVLQSEITELVPTDLRSKYHLIPLTKVGSILTVATSSVIECQAAVSEIQRVSNCLVSFVLAYPSDIADRMTEISKGQTDIDEMLESKAKELTSSKDGANAKLITASDGPVAQVINHLLGQAISNNASDVHFEPSSETLRVRFREDGILREVKTFDKVFTSPFSAAIKVMSSMDIAETRLPQDGSISAVFSGRKIDFRVATYPTEHGEKIVLRILDSNKDWISVNALGLPERVKQSLIQLIESPQGLILCAGPTGSGKTSTLYALLGHLNTTKRNILTVEDPIEFRIKGISQAQVNKKKGLTFATALRAMLRLDPNIILVGEMRDKETAEIGAEAALTGHLVLSTIHANSASQTMSRLIDIGVEPFVVANSLLGVISQRLLRRLCPKCKVPYKPTQEELSLIGWTEDIPDQLMKGAGCGNCRGEGFKGRVPVMEFLIVHNDMRSIISNKEDAGALFAAARAHGMWTIHEDARDKIKNGITMISEAIRVLGIPPKEPSALKAVG